MKIPSKDAQAKAAALIGLMQSQPEGRDVLDEPRRSYADEIRLVVDEAEKQIPGEDAAQMLSVAVAAYWLLAELIDAGKVGG